MKSIGSWLVGGFNDFFIFNHTWGNDPILTIFSIGLKPPTRIGSYF